jgi:Pyruvate/2-oxoacid:ferredoxin oxidoreductase gamma subunit
LPFADEHWQKALRLVVPAKIIDVNRRAFELGRDTVSQEVGE